MAEEIRALSAALARDPSSLVYVQLAEALRRRGNLAEAVQVALHGLGRHPDHADGYDCLARIHSDRDDLDDARAAWERALAIHPEHLGALKGIGFLYFRQGERRRAAEALEHALAVDPADDATRRALAMVRGAGPEAPAPAPEPEAEDVRLAPEDVPQLRATASAMRAQASASSPPPPPAAPAERAEADAGVEVGHVPAAPPASRPPVFFGLEGATADLLLLDGRGLVMAGGLKAADGSDASELAAAALAGVSGEAGRTAGYLGLGEWNVIVAEAEFANVVLAPVGEGALLMARRDKSTPVGLALRIAERARIAAAKWLATEAG